MKNKIKIKRALKEEKCAADSEQCVIDSYTGTKKIGILWNTQKGITKTARMINAGTGNNQTHNTMENI